MSMGYLLPPPQPHTHLTLSGGNDDPTQPERTFDTTPISWRGLMVTKAMEQLLHSVSWGPLDLLVLDLPPGTGDVQLTINQTVALDGAVIISTPQDIALRDAVRGTGLFSRMDVPVLGMVRNMAFFACPHCGTHTRIFSSSKHSSSGHDDSDYDAGVSAACARLGVDFLGDIPLDTRVCEDADRGVPTVVAEERDGDGRSARRDALMAVAERIAGKVGLEWPK